MKKTMLLLGLAILLFVVATSGYENACSHAWDPDYARVDQIWNWSINPCISKTVNFSSMVEVRVLGASYYRVPPFTTYCQNYSARVQWNYGTVNESDSGWTEYANTASAAQKLWSFNLSGSNESMVGPIMIKLSLKYDSNATQDSIIFNMTIAPEDSLSEEYVVWGDCKTTALSVFDEPEDNAFWVSTEGLSGWWTRSVIWAFLTMLVVGAAWFGMASSEKFKGITTTMVGLVTMLMIIIGAAARMISWVIPLVIIGVGLAVFLGPKIARIITGGEK